MKRLFLLGVVAMGAMIDARGFTVRVCPENHFTDQEAAWWTERADRTIVLSNAVTAAQGAQLDGVWLPPGRTATLPPPVPAGRALRTERLSASRAAVTNGGFQATLRVDLADVREDERLWAVPGGVELYVRKAGRFAYDRGMGNYLPFSRADGACPVLEAKLPGPAARIGIPLAAVPRDLGEEEVRLNYDGTHWQLSLAGLFDEEFPWYAAAWPEEPVATTFSPRVRAAAFRLGAASDLVQADYGPSAARPVTRPIQYWTPNDHNAWVGDVVCGFDRGRFHVFYLYDRRHHKSRAGRGAHYFAHLSTTNLTEWFEHPALALTAPWESHGTGTPFRWEGKYHLAYGLHTVRTVPWAQTTGPAMAAWRAAHGGAEGIFRMSDLAPAVPQGGTYASSADGLRFEKSGVLFTAAQNPTVYNRPDGSLGLADYVRLWRSDRFGGWTVADDTKHARGDCPSVFSWKGHSYVIQGFFMMDHSASGKPGTWEAWEESGDDLYEGLAVPMVAPWHGDRRILAGWINHVHGWGGWLCLRELVAEPDGRLGTKWLPEAPPPGDVRTFEVAAGATFAHTFVSEQGARLELRVDAAERRAQFSDCGADGVAPRRETLREILMRLPAKERTINAVNRQEVPHRGGNFAIGKVRGVDRDYTVRVAVWYDAKSDATLFDAEIAGRRTLVCRRPGKYAYAESPDLARDPNRPQLRYTPRFGWVNDPNGLTWQNGEWRFFYQHNPTGTQWGNMHWGYAVSTDLVHWEERKPVLAPDAMGMMFSGSGVVDRENTAGFGKDAHVLLYTAAGEKGKPFTQCLAFSRDGRRYEKYAGNPVIPQLSPGNRDPKVFWHAPTRAWVMALYGEENGRHVAWILTSPDLKTWTKRSTVTGGETAKKDRWLYECPGLEELKIEGEDGTAWVLWGADNAYAVGTFDGAVFRPEVARLAGVVAAREGGMPYYAAQTFSNAPDGRAVWVAWYRLPKRPCMDFTHAFSLPQELSLRRTPEGLRLVRRPARELAALREGAAVPFALFDGELAEIDVACTVASDGRLALDLRGVPLVYDAAKGTLTVAGRTFDWPLDRGRLAFKAFLDRVGLEIFSADGLRVAAVPEAWPKPPCRSLAVTARTGVTEASFRATRLRSIWTPRAVKPSAPVAFDDFERADWGAWTVTGTAFGKSPVTNTLPRQARVGGFRGRSFITSYHGGDGATGTLTSAAFTVTKPYVNFLIGGGRAPDRAELQLLVDGKVVRAQTGWNEPADGPGIGETLHPASFDVRAFRGRTARLRVVDTAREGWGHVNVDAITFDEAPPAPPVPAHTRTFVAAKPYVLFPMWNCGPGSLRRRLTVFADGAPIRVMDVLLPEKDPDWWAWMDVSAYKGQALTFQMDVTGLSYDPLATIEAADRPREAANLYDEPNRPQLKFSPRQGWLNDPNGLVYRDGKWLLFYQHNPFSVWWGNLHWGYAESTDLVHWTDHGAELVPEPPHRDIISGSGVVDRENTAGFGKDAHVILVKYGPGLCAWTAPDGRHYAYWPGNPLSRAVPGADPKVIWYAKGKKWICLTHGVEDRTYTVYICSSPNLRDWTLESKFYGDHVSKGRQQYLHECPGLEELRIRGEKGTAWILWGANAVSAIGSFDGKVFTPVEERIPTYQRQPGAKGWPWYAAQAFQNGPDGRVVLMPWLTLNMVALDRRSAFNQALGIPQELDLVRTAEGLRLARRPVREMDALRAGPAVPLADFAGELAEVNVSCRPGPDARIEWDMRGVPFAWDARTEMLTMGAHGKVAAESVKWPLVNGTLAFRLYVDRVGFEAFSPDGLLAAPFRSAFPDRAKRRITVKTTGPVADASFTATPLRSIWSAAHRAR